MIPTFTPQIVQRPTLGSIMLRHVDGAICGMTKDEVRKLVAKAKKKGWIREGGK